MEISTSGFQTDPGALINRGALNVLAMAETTSALVPQTTKWWRKYYSEKPYDFPHQEVLGVNSVQWDPRSTRADLQNYLLKERYFNK
jgi:hypothetical protein